MKKNKKIIPLFFIIIVAFFSCEEDIIKPDSMRITLRVEVIDTSIFTKTLSGDSLVSNANVYINSISYSQQKEALTDSNGVAVFENLLPDNYSITISKNISKEDAMKVNGNYVRWIMSNQIQDTMLFDIIDKEIEIRIILKLIKPGTLIFSEIYYNGSPANPIPYYFHDQFTEIYNNSSETIYLDSLMIADVDYGHKDEDVIHSIHSYMFPGDGTTYPIAPGEYVIVAQDAINHSEINPGSVDLHNADFEYYVKDHGDVDNPDITNMIQIQHKYGIDFLYSVMNDAIVLMKVKDPFALGYDTFDCLLLPKSAVIDGVEYREKLSEMDKKRLDATIDGGITGGLEMYQGKSIERKFERFEDDRAILMDNNNSSIDFHVLDTATIGYNYDVNKIE
ncbi:MAG: DUF4876 domain-containing protein [Patescibacteria group bacterium]|nr:DUF4876 domain-containing protein [Patescibacteria group bacterium]MEA3501098.1 DUF4876 domain-containing protein [Candidatus Neomarinimicrobiota bacterium]